MAWLAYPEIDDEYRCSHFYFVRFGLAGRRCTADNYRIGFLAAGPRASVSGRVEAFAPACARRVTSTAKTW
jgi:hypothetical protein